MENIILEMKKIVDDSKNQGDSLIKIRNKLKEYLHYFVLDFIYNSEFKEMIFYGGSCLRIIYDLPRMSIDLDFEVEEGMNLDKFKSSLEKYFSAGLNLKDKFYIRGEEKGKNINRIFLNFILANEIGLSPHKDESLRIRIDINSVSSEYLKELAPILTLKSDYGKSLVIRHYDLPTLFAGKLVAVLDRSEKGFFVGKEEERIDFKGRDFYDLWWYMEKRILPNKKMLKLKGLNGSIGDVFDDISLFISKRKLEEGLRNDLEPLFLEPVDNFVDNFRTMFQRLKEENYVDREIRELNRIIIRVNSITDVISFKFNFLCKDNTIALFLFRVGHDFVYHSEKPKNNAELKKEHESKINWDGFDFENVPTKKDLIKRYAAFFLSKIEEYLKRNNNKTEFTHWESKLIRMTKDNFNPEKEIIFSSGSELANNKKITLEILSF